MTRVQLGKKEIQAINDKINADFGVQELIGKSSAASLVDDKLVFVDNEPWFFYLNQRLVPCLKLVIKNNFLKKIVVDMGAVKFVSSGADVMRPGIVSIDESIRKGDLVAVIDQKNSVPLAVGEALFEGQEMASMKVGKVIKSLHHIGDDIWKVTTDK
jgi:PUA domain protein